MTKWMPALAMMAGLFVCGSPLAAQDPAGEEAATIRIDVPPPADSGAAPADEIVAKPPPVRHLRTILSASLDAPLNDSGSVVYSAAFQQAWDELGGRIGVKPDLGDNAMARALNAATLGKNTDDAFTVVAAGPATDVFRDRLKMSLAAKYGDFAPPLPTFTAQDQAMVIYACMQSRVRYAVDFAPSRDATLPFRGIDGDYRVKYYGCSPRAAARYSPHVTVILYENEDNFILVVDTARDGEKVILAKLPNPSTLSDAVITVARQQKAYANAIAERPGRMVDFMLPHGSSLLIPVLYVERRAQFPTLHKTIGNYNDWTIAETYQDVRLLMDHAGTPDKTPAAAPTVTPSGRPLNLVFNKPFLAALWKDGASEPYMAVWVNGGDVLRN